MKINILAVFAAVIIVSCNKDNKPTYIEGVGTVSSNAVQAKNSATGMLMPQNTQGSQPVQITPQNGGQPIQIQPQPGQKQQVASGMNPPHGEPGHRCDIAVGAPLNFPAKANTQIQPQQMTVNPVAASAPQSKQKTAPGMNPPHGEPGHRCDIAVGAPLNSAPSKTTQTLTPTNVQTNASAQNLPATVAAPASTGEKTVTAPGMNPPHGEPGHRCDIAVGAPLK